MRNSQEPAGIHIVPAFQYNAECMWKEDHFQKTIALLHAPLALCLFFAARHYFLNWYDFEHVRDYAAGLIFFVLLILLGVAAFFRAEARRIATGVGQPAVIAALIGILLPWAEWLRIGYMSNRSDWTLQWLTQLFFLYACLTFAGFLPRVSLLLDRMAGTVADFLARTRKWPYVILPLAMFTAASFLCLRYQGGLPHMQDGASYLFQAKIFQAGKLWAPVPALRDFFSTPGDMFYAGNGKWFSIFLPGYSLLLTAGWLVHAPWAVTPLLAAISLAFLMLFLRDQFGDSIAVGFALLFVSSPFVLILSSEFMSHVPELAVASAVIYAASRLDSGKGGVACSILFAVALAGGALIRVFSIYAFLFPVLLWFAWTQIRRKHYSLLAVPALGMALGITLLFWYQWKTSGNPLVSGYLLQYPEYRFGFGETFLHQKHTPLLGLENTSNHMISFNQYLTAWPAGSFLFPVLFLVLTPRLTTWEKLLLACGGCILLFHFFFVGIELGLGPRLIFLCAVPAFLLNVRGIQSVWNSLEGRRRSSWIVVLFACIAGFLFVSGPRFLKQFDRSNFPNVQLSRQLAQKQGQRLLIFVTEDSRYSDTLLFNSPFLDSNTIVARDLGDRNSELIRLYEGYQPLYFKLEQPLVRKKGMLASGSGFVLSTERPAASRPELSYFEFLAMVQTAAGFHIPDLFDIAPSTALSRHCKDVETFLASSQNRAPGALSRDYQLRFHSELDSLIRLLVLPQCVYEKSEGRWQSAFDPGEFRRRFEDAREKSKDVPELSVEIQYGLHKIEQRVDQDRDGRLSDPEILHYVDEKMKELRRRSFLEKD